MAYRIEYDLASWGKPILAVEPTTSLDIKNDGINPFGCSTSLSRLPSKAMAIASFPSNFPS